MTTTHPTARASRALASPRGTDFQLCRRPDKFAFPTRSEAKRAAKRVNRAEGDHMGEYRCPAGHWHIGHGPR